MAGALELLQQVDKDAIDAKQTRANYLFELGSVLDKLGRYPEAFAAYREANEAKNCYVGRIYDAGEDLNIFQKLKETFSKEAWPRLSRLSATLGDASPAPVFIVGFPRSGTSLLEQVLGAHREISPAGELTFVNDVETRVAGRITGSAHPFPLLLDDPEHPLDAEKLQAMRDFYLSEVHKLDITGEHTRWVTDKMPHNAMKLATIRLLFPRAPIIHISRHPLNPCLSAYFANFKSSHRYTSSLAATAMHYRNVMDLLDHYRDIGIDFLEIHYEDLVRDQEAVVRQVLDYIGAPWDEACLQHHKSDRVVRTASYEQVTQKVYTSSLNRYQNYWDAVQEIIPILQSTIERFGYSVEPPPAH
jgi:tetratricopeptide (TPR) repeat protein